MVISYMYNQKLPDTLKELAAPPFWIPWLLLDDLQGQQECNLVTTTRRTQVLQWSAGRSSQLMSYKHFQIYEKEGSALANIIVIRI